MDDIRHTTMSEFKSLSIAEMKKALETIERNRGRGITTNRTIYLDDLEVIYERRLHKIEANKLREMIPTKYQSKVFYAGEHTLKPNMVRLDLPCGYTIFKSVKTPSGGKYLKEIPSTYAEVLKELYPTIMLAHRDSLKRHSEILKEIKTTFENE